MRHDSGEPASRRKPVTSLHALRLSPSAPSHAPRTLLQPTPLTQPIPRGWLDPLRLLPRTPAVVAGVTSRLSRATGFFSQLR